MTVQYHANLTSSQGGQGAVRDQSPASVPNRDGEQSKHVNVGDTERSISVAAGSALALLGLSRRSVPGLLLAGIGGAMIYRGATGHCPAYEAAGIDTTEDGANRQLSEDEIAARGIHVEQAFLINRSPQDLYAFWRDFTNLPKVMTHLERVDVQEGGKRSHWVAQLSRMAGGHLEWDAEITRDEPNSVIAWRSLPGSDIDTTGEVRFSAGMGDRGTEVRISMSFIPPAGGLARMFPAFFTKATRKLIRSDLRQFKQLMETGEIATIDGQPRGSCLGGSGTRDKQD